VGISNNTEIISYKGIDTSKRPHRLIGVTRGESGTTAMEHKEGAQVTEYVPTGRGVSVKSLTLQESPCHAKVWIDDGTTQGASPELRSLVEKRLRGDRTVRDPGYKGGGIVLDVAVASIVQVNIEVGLIYEAGYDVATVRGRVQGQIDAFLNDSYVGEDVSAYQVACTILQVPGVANIVGLKLNSVAFDGRLLGGVAIGQHQVARSGGASTHLIS
jgi:hypothetical protein